MWKADAHFLCHAASNQTGKHKWRDPCPMLLRQEPMNTETPLPVDSDACTRLRYEYECDAQTIPYFELTHPSRDAGTIYLLASGGYGASYPPFLRPYRHNRHRAGVRSATGACGAFGPWLLTGLMLKVFRLPVSSLRTLPVHIGSKDRYGKRSACRWPRHVRESVKGKKHAAL